MDGESPPPGNQLTALLWVAATLLALYEFMWYLADRLYPIS
jgi:hypothetical protein